MENEVCLHNGGRPPVARISGPDGLEAWLVALAACFINFVMAGLGRMSGILYVALIDIFQTDRRQASLPFSVRSSIRNLLGPVVGILGQKYGVRPVIIVGGLIGTISAASCFDINDIIWITVVWGGINGVGTALTTTLPQVVIGQHFEKYRSTASGMAFSGGCVGSFLFPALIEYLLYTYDLGGTFLIIAGIIMHVIPAALILKTPSWWNDKKTAENQELTINCDKDEAEKASEFHQENEVREIILQSVNENQHGTSLSESNNLPSSTPLLCNQGVEEKESLKCNIHSEFLWQNRNILIKVLTNNFTLHFEQSHIKHYDYFRTDDVFVKGIELLLRKLETNVSNGDIDMVNAYAPSVKTECAIKSTGSENIQFANGDIISKGTNDGLSMMSINYIAYSLEKLFERDKSDILQHFSEEQHKDVNKILQDLEELHTTLKCNYNSSIFISRPPKDSRLLQTTTNSREINGKRSNTFYSHIVTAFKLYKKPLFLLICLCRSVHFMTFIPAVTIIVDFTMDKGLPSEDGKYVIAALSLGDLLGRLCLGWITDWGYVTLPRYMLSVMVLQAAATVTLPVMQSRAGIMTSIAVFGLLQGSAFVRHPVLVSRYLDDHEQFIAMGCINFFSGLIGFILPLYIGFFRDTVGSYAGLFYINGSLGAFIGVLWLFEPYCLKISARNDSSGNPQIKV